MAKTKRTLLSTEEKLYRAVQALFILQARQVDMSNKEMREILGVDIDAVTKVINKAIKRHGKDTEKRNS